jgi:hypothetical protein
VIERIALGKKFRRFTIEITEDLITEFRELFTEGEPDSPLPAALPLTWPMLLTLRGTACLIPVWEELGADPLHMRLVAEEFEYDREPVLGEELTGQVRIADMDEIVSADHGIEQQVDLAVDFFDRHDRRVALYRCSYRLSLTVSPKAESSSPEA